MIGAFLGITLLFTLAQAFRARAKTAQILRLRNWEIALDRLDDAFAPSGPLPIRMSTDHTYRPAAKFSLIAEVLPAKNLTVTVVDTSKQLVIDHFMTADCNKGFSALDALALTKEENFCEPFRSASFPASFERDSSILIYRWDEVTVVVSYELEGKKKQQSSDALLFLRTATRRFIQNVDAERKAMELVDMKQRLEGVDLVSSLETLTDVIASEFSNTLSEVLGYAERGLMSISKKAADGQLALVMETGRRATIIIEHILATSRDSARMIQPIDLNSFIIRNEDFIRNLLPSRIGLEIYLLDETSNVEANSLDIQRVLVSLCRNSCQSIAGAGGVKITLKNSVVSEAKTVLTGIIPPGAYAQISVEDTGAGIPDIIIGQIFMPFSTKPARTGRTGFELSTVLRQIRALNGYIDVSSTAGSGMRFDISLPIANRQPGALSSFFNLGHVPTGRGETVAIVCKDLDARELYEEKIAALGYEVLGFESVEKFRSWTNKGNVEDVVFADLTTDLEVQHFVHSMKDKKSGKLILVSHFNVIEDLEYAHLLIRPLSSQVLADTLSRCIDKPR